MKSKLSELEYLLALSVSFSVILLAARITITGELAYVFLAWNLFLAIVPMLISRRLHRHKNLNWIVLLYLFCWLLFLPNAPYIVTDIFHFRERPPVPTWVDLLLITSAAWNGLMLGIVSLMQVEKYLLQVTSRCKTNAFVSLSLLLTAFGIYLGRYLRFNSWDIIARPNELFYSLAYRVAYPFDNARTWGFTLLFSLMFSLCYFTIRKISIGFRPET